MKRQRGERESGEIRKGVRSARSNSENRSNSGNRSNSSGSEVMQRCKVNVIICVTYTFKIT